MFLGGIRVVLILLSIIWFSFWHRAMNVKELEEELPDSVYAILHVNCKYDNKGHITFTHVLGDFFWRYEHKSLPKFVYNPSNRYIINIKYLHNWKKIIFSAFLSHLNSFLLKQEQETEKKNRLILDTLDRRGQRSVKCLYNAFQETLNDDLADLLADYAKLIDNKENLNDPKGIYI